MPSKIMLTEGQRIGHLTVLFEDGRSHGSVMWRCRCDCGREIRVKGSHPSPRCRSCSNSQTGVTHGLTMTSLYGRWAKMLTRTRNPNDQSWSSYGGRGITVCERWHSFTNFAE